MKAIRIWGLTFVITGLVWANTRTGNAQTPNAVYHSDAYAVSISMEKEIIPASQSPIVSLVIKNISDKRIDRNDCSSDPRVWVRGEHGEPPTRYRERFSTQRLLPGEPDLACTLNMTWSLAPGEVRTEHFLLKYLYDLHNPGKYSVYVEFPTEAGWLRANKVDFQVLAEGSVQDERDASAASESNR